MTPQSPQAHRIRKILTVSILISLVAVFFVQQTRIRALEQAHNGAPEREVVSNTGRPSARAGRGDGPPATRDHRRLERPLDQAGQEHTAVVEKQLAEISAPLIGDMASTMFNAEVKKGQSVVTGGYQTADGRNQFTILKPRIVTGRNGGKQIEIDSNLIAMSQEDTKQSGLDSLATNAKNTLQHAESWEESNVSSTMELIQNSTGSEHLGQPKAVVAPGEKFTIQMTSDDQGSYTLSGTAELSADGSGVVLKARIEQKDAQK